MVDDTTTDAAEARAPGHDEVPTLEQATRWLKRFSNQDEVASTTPRKIAFELAGIHSLLLSLATAEAASGAGERDHATLIQVARCHLQWIREGGNEHEHRLEQIERALAAYEALTSLPPATDPAIPDGWRLVPVEATALMIQSGIVAHEGCVEDGYGDNAMREAWNAALAAAPTILATGEIDHG